IAAAAIVVPDVREPPRPRPGLPLSSRCDQHDLHFAWRMARRKLYQQCTHRVDNERARPGNPRRSDAMQRECDGDAIYHLELSSQRLPLLKERVRLERYSR